MGWDTLALFAHILNVLTISIASVLVSLAIGALVEALTIRPRSESQSAPQMKAASVG